MRRFLLGVCALAWCTTASPLSAQSVADFYRGKQVELRIGSAPGSGYDLTARVIGHYLGKYIPGNPTVIFQNVPGASSLLLANQLANTAPRDGTVLAVVTNGVPTAPLLAPDATHFDPRQFGWIGSSAPETELAMVWHTAAVQSVDDLFTKPLVIGSAGPGTAQTDIAAVTNAVVGTKFKIVNGYEGTAQIELALQRGEVEGIVGLGWITAKTRDLAWLKDGTAKIITQFGLEKHPELQDVPLFPLPSDPAKRQAIMLVVGRAEYGRPMLTAPNVPADRLAALRQAFAETMKDPDFIQEATKAELEVNPVSGERLQQLTDDIMKTDPDVAAHVKTILAQAK
ncbi:MAG TPA: hypothetical protein VG271_07490 [Beijerinckiaceae bacterium]|nr:hypothetical protein [Beijerinckiaceae bacterium]